MTFALGMTETQSNAQTGTASIENDVAGEKTVLICSLTPVNKSNKQIIGIWTEKNPFFNKTTVSLPSDAVFDYDTGKKQPIALSRSNRANDAEALEGAKGVPRTLRGQTQRRSRSRCGLERRPLQKLVELERGCAFSKSLH